MSPRASRLTGVVAEPFPWARVPGRPAPRAAADTPAAERLDSAATRDRLAALEREAFVKGYAQGERAGAEAAARQGDDMVRRLAETVDDVASTRAELMRRSERELVQLAILIAERVIRREMSVDRQLVVAMAKVAIDRLGERVATTIRLHPADHAALSTAANGVPLPGPVELVADSMVARGGCIVQSDLGQMDLGIASQLAELSHALLGADSTPDVGVETGIGIAHA